MNTAQNASKGFTLIEILIALGVFALIAGIAASILSEVLTTNSHLRLQSQYAHDLEFGISLLRRDTTQILNRPVRDDQQHRIPAWIGQAYYVEFTRSGVSNPGAIAKRSSLLRIAYLCQQGRLIRRTWPLLDAPNRYQYHDVILINGLQACQFNFMNRKGQMLTEWHAVDHEGKVHAGHLLPIAMICTLSFSQEKSISVTLPLAVGFYD